MSADFTNPRLAPEDYWWFAVDKAPRCESCGARLDKADRVCPFAPHEEAVA